MREKGARAAGHRQRWVTRIGSGLALVAGLDGLAAVVRFTRSYLSSGYPELSLTPDLFTLEVLYARVSGFRSLAGLAAGFLLSCILALATKVKPSSRLFDVLVLLLGMVLTVLSLLGGLAVGGYTIYAAVVAIAGWGSGLAFAPNVLLLLLASLLG